VAMNVDVCLRKRESILYICRGVHLWHFNMSTGSRLSFVKGVNYDRGIDFREFVIKSWKSGKCFLGKKYTLYICILYPHTYILR